MCGLTGFLDASRSSTRAEMERDVGAMAASIVHRGPDDGGTWIDEAAGMAFGFRRLAIVDLSAEGHQPMRSRGGRFVLAFNGEIYNHGRLRAELDAAGDSGPGHWRGHSDTEVLLAGFERWGIAATVGRAVGMFAIAAWDRETRRLTLVRDRLGEKPLYYGWQGSTLLFGSELKALRAHPAFRAEIDRDALAAFLRHSCVPAPRSIHRGIVKLPASSLVTLSTEHPGRLPDPLPYWSAAEVARSGVCDPFRGSEAAAIDELDARLREAVGLQMVADVPLGALLSGGVDSSAIVALMQAQSGRPVRTFSIGFNDPSLNEAEHAKAVAAHLGTDHTELYVDSQDALEVIPRLPFLYDEPFADSSQIPTFLVSQMARRDVTVALSGDGGDELFGGYTRHVAADGLWRRARRLPPGVRSALSRGLVSLPPERWDRLAAAASPILPGSLRPQAPGEKLHKLAAMLPAVDADGLYDALVVDWADADAIVIGASGHANGHAPPPPFADVRQRMMLRDLLTYLPDDVLVKVDRASMGVGLEVRAPFLDHRVVEFAWRLPMEMKIRDGRGKWILRQVLDRYVPRALIDRPKSGFTPPLRAWLRGPLRPWAEDLLGERRLRDEGLLHPAPIRSLWRDLLDGKGNSQERIWDVLMFQSWLDAQGPPN
ncbi:MAG: asparagine synthase (glutamine-hydrolyzing) [Thermomicrobiales bacterium]